MTDERLEKAPGADSAADREARDGPPPILFQDRYELGPILGRGGTCTVYRAWDTRLHRYVALKRLEPPLSEDEHTRARFNREGKAIARLSHPSLVTLIDRGSTEDTEYLVYEYVEGRSLKQVVTDEGPLDPKRAAGIAGQVAEGLSAAHLAGIYHRDVKPQNILLEAEGRARLTDFGIATGPEWTRVTRAGAIVGSSRYMSPEQVQGRPVDARTDIYSLGIVLYEMLAGAPPFDGTSIAEIGRQHIRAQPTPVDKIRPDLPPGLGRVVGRCLEKLPESRFQSMDEFLGALVALDFYELERPAAGVLDSLRKAGHAIKASAIEAATGAIDSTTGSHRGVDAAAAAADDALHAPLGARDDGWAPGWDDISTDAIWDDFATDSWDWPGSRTETPAQRPPHHLALAALPFLVLALLITGWFTFIRPTPSMPTTPDVRGKSLEDAKAAAQQAHMTLKVGTPVLSPAIAPGTVVGQRPLPETKPEDKILTIMLARGPLPVKVASLKDFDPEGDGIEHPEFLTALIDGKPDTAWRTELYRAADFKGIKQGVGVIFTLKEPASVVRVDAASEGWAGELRARASDGSTRTVAKLSGKKSQVITLKEPLLTGEVWITRLAPAQEAGRFSVELTELTFSR